MTPGPLSILNPSPIKLPGPALLHHLVASAGDGHALEYLARGQRCAYTYRHLDDAAEALACRITDARRRAARDQPDFIVPVFVAQSPLLYISLLAVLKAGGAFCPLDTDAPPERIAFILKDVSAQVVLASSHLAPNLLVHAHVEILQADQVDGQPHRDSCRHRQPCPDDLAYVMYTSGSTGSPKGVAVSHSAATQALLAHDPHIPAFSRFLQFAAPTFDVSVFETFFPLFRGAILIAARRDEMLDDLPAVLRHMDVDACELTPTVAASLLKARRNAPGLKLLLTIGEMLNEPVVREFGSSPGQSSILWAMYGPTEATIHCTLQTALASESATSNIGTPLATVSCFVVEPCGPGHDCSHFRPLPRGDIGELAVGGHQLARGYLNRPEQTASSFIQTPYGRLYRTGDRARVTADGKLQCLGRLAGGQVKLRGQRIELGEIEQAVLSTPGCHGAVAAVVDSNLVVFCAVDSHVAQADVVMQCKRWLPLFMVPREVVLLPDLPRLPSGKVDSRRLKSSYGEQKLADLGDAAAPGECAETGEILRVASLALGLSVSRAMTLASAGVDSLSAIRLASALRLSGFVATAPDLLKLKTISDICHSIRRPPSASVDPEAPNVSLMAELGQLRAQNPELALPPDDVVEDVLPCTALQSAMLAETVRDARLYSNEMELRAVPGLAVDDVVDAIRQLVQRNEMLRTGFVQWSDGFVAVLHKGVDASDTIQTVREFRRGLAFTQPQDFLKPLRFQLRQGLHDAGLHILVQAHHAVYDGWSMDLIISDLSALLGQMPLTTRPQFRKILHYDTRHSKKSADNLARRFWSENLLGWSKTTFPRLTSRTSATDDIMTARHRLQVLPDQVQQLAKQAGLSSQVPFQASLALLWSHIAGGHDVMLGSVTSGRTIPVDRIEEIIGPCIASLPLRVNLDGMVTYGDLLMSIQASNRAIMEHCGLPLSDIRRLVGLRPSESFYDVLFVYQDSLEAKRESARFFTEVEHVDRLETKLLFEVQPDKQGFTIQATYHDPYFPHRFVECLMQQFEGVLQALVDRPESEIPAELGSAMPGQSIHNESSLSLSEAPDLAAQFESMAARIPEATALCFQDSSSKTQFLSYRELNEEANRVAHYLESRGVAVGEVVTVVMPKSLLFYTSVLGVVKAGCAYLPILPSTPQARVRIIMNQAQIRHCLVDGASCDLSPVEGVQFHEIERTRLMSYSTANREVPADGSRLAYVIYTSGTTGEPKGVAVTQKNIASNIAFLGSVYPSSRSARPRLLQACSQAFDVSVFEIFFAWYKGMCLCAADNDDLFGDLENCIRRMQITHLSLTPTVASLVDPDNVPAVEFLVTAGEPMTLSVLDRWDDLLWQGYGPSETTNICSVKRMKRGDNIEHLGWALPNTSTFVLRPASLDTVPLGWIGEFCFGGDQVARGYLNDERQTSERFIDHPKFGRIYRSGDLGRMLPDGSLIIIGRLDHQIKLRGQRIEAGEVNGILTSTGLASAAVTLAARREEGTSETLVSFFVPPGADSEFQSLDVDCQATRSLFANLSARVPSYMVPSYLIPVSQIPVGSSGKTNQRRLLACFESLSWDYLEAAASRTERLDDEAGWSQEELAIADVLALSTSTSRADIGRWTPFAAVGVDSISAINISRQLNQELGSPVPISAVLQNPTVAQLAKYMKSHDQGHQKADHQDLYAFHAAFAEEVYASLGQRREDVEEILPCTPLQEGMLSRGTRTYFNKILLRLRIGSEELMTYWNAVSQRHGILRTCFVTTRRAAHPVAQVILKNWAVNWKSFEVREPSLAGAIQEHLACLPEPLDSGQPPVSCALINYKGNRFFSLMCHHAMYDGVAMENLWREIEAMANGREMQPPVAYKPFVQQVTCLPDTTDAFWREHFREFVPSLLFTRRAGAETNQCTHTTSIGTPLDEVQKRLRSLGLSLLSTCQASWATVVSMVCGCLDVAFGNVVNGRTIDLEGLDRLVAPCFNTVPLRMDLSRLYQNIDMMRRFQELSSKMLPFQFTSLRHVQKLAKCQGRSLFDTLLLLQQPLQDMDDSVWTLEEDSGDMDVPLVCELVPCPGLNSIVVKIHYDIGVASGDAATALADAFKCVFNHLIELPFASLYSKDVLSETIQAGLAELIPRRAKPDKENQALDDQPWSDAEQSVRIIMSQLSGVPEGRITRDTTIFRLGLDSINAVQIASMLRQKGYRVSASDVIQFSSCARLAPRLAHVPNEDGQDASLEPLRNYASEVSAQIVAAFPEVGELEAILPATTMQAAMAAAFVQSGGSNYLNMLEYRIDDNVSMDDVVRAWKAVHGRHPMLRTGLVPVNHGKSPFAMIRHAEALIQAPIESISGKEAQGFDSQRWRDEARRVFLQRPDLPPWKVALVDDGSRVTMSVAIHHALYDAVSLEELLGAVSRFIRDGTLPEFPRIEPALAEMLDRSKGKQSEAQHFWNSHADKAVVNKFPLLTPLREEASGLATLETVSSMSFEDLSEAAGRCETSIQAAIQSAWARVLASYLGESSVVFGVTMSGRTTDVTEDTPLPCIATVPVVVTNVESNRKLLNEMMQYNADLHEHQLSPLGQVQKWLGHAASPVFDTLLVYQRRENTRSEPWTLIKDQPMVEYVVSLEVEPTNTGDVCLRLTFAEDVLPREQGSLVVQQFDATLRHLLSQPDGDEHGLFLERADLFAVSPPTSPVLPAPVRLLHEFVEQRSRSDPDAVALEFVSGFDNGPIMRKWSYRQLDVVGNKVANLLRGSTKVGDLVAIHLDKCPEAYFSILGILKAGCSFVALDPNAPKVRKDFILRDSGAKCLITGVEDTLDVEASTNVIRVRDEWLQGCSEERPDLTADGLSPAHTCYCLYTSGTTGTPKGCEISHENTVQAMMAFQELFKGHWEPDSRWLQFAALHFDVSVLEQYWSWSVGITVVAAPRDLILDDVTGVIDRLGITHIDLTPSLARLTHPDEVPSLCRGVFITGGEQLRQDILDAWGPKAVIYNAYGPTEATIGVTMYQRVPVNGRPSNIGRQFPNVGAYVLHPGTETPVLRGAAGELCVSGKLVGKGYLNRPELTAERFPTLSGPGETVYRTGDLVRLLHDGCFDFLGRADDQVKLRGQRLEMGEINHAIRAAVGELRDVATLLVRRGGSGKDVLVSFLVGGPRDNSADLSVLDDVDGLGARARTACLERLPTYMVPSYFVRVPCIPLSPNNKVETRLLKALFEQLSHERLMELSAASTTLQGSNLDKAALGKITRLVSEFSRVPADTIGASTSVLDLGVDSISALQLSSLLRSNGFQTASPALLLRRPVVADLVQALSAAVKPPVDSTREARQVMQACHHRHLGLVCRELGVGPDEMEYIAPCSPLQQGIIFKAMQDEGQGTYFNAFELLLRPGAELEKLRRSWSRLVECHAMLRSVFVATPDGYVQAALRTREPWREMTVREDQVEDTMSAERRRWIDGSKHHVVRPLELIHVHGPGFDRVFMYIFHALYDGNSLELMNQYASVLYHDDEPAAGPPFVEALVHGPLQRHDQCRQFWIEHMRGWASLPPPEPPRPASLDAVAVSRSVSLARLEKLRVRQHVTMHSVVLALWAAALQKHLAAKTAIGVVVSGRSMELAGVERTIGPLFNTVPFLVDALRGRTWASLIGETHLYNTSILPIQHVPLKSVQKWCSGGRPMFNNLFVFQVEQPQPAGRDVPWTLADVPGPADYPLAFEATQGLAGELRVSVVAQSCFADSHVLEDLLCRFEQEVDAAQAEELVSSSSAQEGMEKPADQGLEDTCSDGAEDGFEWTDRATLVREEMAALAGVSPDEVTPTTTLLQLGLDSIDTMKLSARLNQKEVSLSSSRILRCQNISRMLQQLDLHDHGSSPVQGANSLSGTRAKLWTQAEKAGLDLEGVESVLPPTALQEAMVAGMTQSGLQWYFNHDVLEVADWVDVDRLAQAWQRVIESSPILRTGFIELDDAELDMAYCQVAFRHVERPVRTLCLAGTEGLEDVMRDATRHAAQEKGLGSLAQFTIAIVEQQRFVVLSMAHALYDGWSLGLLFRDLEAAYEGRLTPRPPFDSVLSRMLASSTAEAHDFWASYLAGVRPTLLAGRRGITEPSRQRLRRERKSDKTLLETMELCKTRSISMQVLCAACWAMVVAEQVGALDVVFGVILSGRDADGAHDVLFPTMNAVAMRCVLHGSVSAFLHYVEESMADVRAFQAFPLRRAHAAAGLSGSAMFDSLFLVQRGPEGGDASNAMIRSVRGESAVEYPVCAEAEAVGDGLIWRVACDEAFFSNEETDGLVEKVDRVLCFMLENQDADVLSFEGQGVSICGMPAVPIKDHHLIEANAPAPSAEGDSWSETGLAIRNVLSKVSQVPVEAISPRASLYQLGLDSISAVKVSMLLRKEGIHVKPRELVRLPTIREIVNIASLGTVEPGPRAPSTWMPPSHIDTGRLLSESGLPQESVEHFLPATPMQVYMLTAWQNSAGSVFFPEFCYRVHGVVGACRVREAWSSLVDEAAILRTRFIATGCAELPWIQVVVAKEDVRSCRVSQPLVRLGLDELDQGLRLRLKVHHALYDGFSLSAIVSRLCELLNGAVSREDHDITRWTRYCIAPCLPEARGRRREFWTKYLGHGAAAVSLVSPCAEPGERVSHLNVSAIADVGPLRATASRSGIGLQSLFLAGLATSLGRRDSRHSEESFVLGIYLANQTADEGDSPPAAYPTLALVPLKVRLGGGEDLVALAREIQQDIHSISSEGRAEVGLWEILEWTGVKVDCFVNFLAGELSERDAAPEADAAVMLTPDQDPDEVPAMNGEGAGSELLEQSWVRQNTVRDAFPPSVDVEASVRDQKLAMGVFGPSTLVSDQWAAGLVADTAGLLMTLGQG